jgi:hypothetical protein
MVDRMASRALSERRAPSTMVTYRIQIHHRPMRSAVFGLRTDSR